MPLSGHDDVALFESTKKSKVMSSQTMGKLINRIPGSHLIISSLPGSALRTLVESLGKHHGVNKCSQSLAWYT